MEELNVKETKVEEKNKVVKKKPKEKLQERIEKLNKLGKFNLLPELDIEKKEFKILKEVQNSKKKIDFLKLCRTFDMKPSRLNDSLAKLSKKKLVEYKNDVIELTELGERFAIKESCGDKKDKKFKSFISVLSDEEFNEFYDLCKNVKSGIKDSKNTKEGTEFPNIFMPM